MSVEHRHQTIPVVPRRRRTTTPSSSSTILLFSLLLLAPPSNNNIPLSSLFVTASEDKYCGIDWTDAVNTCPHPCPEGTDKECVGVLGEGYECFIFTGCWDRVQAGEFGVLGPPTKSPTVEEDVVMVFPTVAPSVGPTEVEHTAFCGVDWMDAMLTCDDTKAATPCPDGGKECPPLETCHTEISCQSPLILLNSELLFTLDGVSSTMSQANLEIFTSTISEVIGKELEGLQISFESMEVTQQQLGSSFDYVYLTIVMTARYRPQNTDNQGDNDESSSKNKNLNVIVSEYIDKQSLRVILKLKQAAASIMSFYFTKVDGIGVGMGRTKTPTVVPTGFPSGKPTTRRPTSPPSTKLPTVKPTEFPSGMPSASPSRSYLQSITTSTTQELQSLTDTGYGYLFNIRTTPTGPAIILTGMDFYSDRTGPINYELWSRAGSYKGFRGTYEGWDLLATGTVEGRGVGRYTSIPKEEFTSVGMPGGGSSTNNGTRAFYLTLNTNDLLYQMANTGGGAEVGTRAHASTPELELYEGEAVLSYPFPDPSQSYYYRAPRQFVGAIHYDRLPCKPFSMFGPIQEFPCPVIQFPTSSPTTTPPTEWPTGPVPSASPITLAPMITTMKPTVMMEEPTSSPVRSPTVSPTASHAPTLSFPPTGFPTLSPVVPIRVNIVMTLRAFFDDEETMNGRERGAFINIFSAFLNRHTGERLVVDGVDLWDQQLLVLVDDGDVSSENDNANAQQSSNPSSPQVERRKIVTNETALQLTLILRISFTTLPSELVGNMAVVTIQENQGELLGGIMELSDTYPYFVNVTGIDVFATDTLEKLTLPPMSSPVDVNGTIIAESENESGDDSEEANGSKVGVIVGITMGIFWVCLAATGLLYLRTARSRMSNRKATESLTKSQQDPIKHDPTLLEPSSQRNSSPTIPMGMSCIDWENVSVDGNSHRKIGPTKAGVAKSLTAERLKSREQALTSRLAYSDVVTAKEREVVTAKEREMMLKEDNSDRTTNSSSLEQQQAAKGNGELSKSFEEALLSDDDGVGNNEREEDDHRGGGGASLKRSMNSQQKNNHGKSLIDMEFEEAMLSSRCLQSSNRGTSLNESVRSDSHASTVRSLLSDDDRVENNEREEDDHRGGGGASLKRSMNSQQKNNHRKSLIDMEFEEAMLSSRCLQSSNRITPLNESVRSDSHASTVRPSLTRRSSSTRSINSRGSNNLQKSLVDNMEFKEDLQRRRSLPMTEDATVDHRGTLRKSLTKPEESSELRRSATRKAAHSLRKSGTKGNSDNFEKGYREAAKRTGRKRTAGGSQPLNQSDSGPKTNGELALLRKSITKGNSDKGGHREAAKRTERKRTAGGSRPLSQSVKVSRTKSEMTSLRKSRTKSSADDMPRLVMEARNSRSLRRSTTGSRMNNGERTSLQRSRTMGSTDDTQRLVTEARDHTGATSQSLSRSMTGSRMNKGEMASPRRSARKGSLDNSVTSRDEPHAVSRTKGRPANLDDRPALDQSATRRTERHGLSKSMQVTKSSELGIERPVFAYSRPKDLGEYITQGKLHPDLRRSATQGNADLTGVRQSRRRRNDGDLAGHKSSAKRSGTRGEKSKHVSELKGNIV